MKTKRIEMARCTIPYSEKCYRCNNKAERKERDHRGKWTRKYICKKCYGKDYYLKIIKRDPNSQPNIIKLLANRRIENLRPNSPQAKGDMFEELTCIWRGVKNLNIENDNYCFPTDHSEDEN